MSLARRLATLRRELDGTGSPGDKALRVTQKGLRSLGLSPRVSLERCIIVELAALPPAVRGLSDLVVRPGGEGDLDALCAIDATPPALVRERLARGDQVFVGVLDDEILCHTWFHRGPTPFLEERLIFAPWALGEDTVWSYHGVARVEARTTGVFAKLFQVALTQMLQTPGVRRVRGFIHDTNAASLAMHARLGFTHLGRLTAASMPGVKWLRWTDESGTRQWVLRRGGDFALQIPPA